jgi:hypothetical protein
MNFMFYENKKKKFYGFLRKFDFTKFLKISQKSGFTKIIIYEKSKFTELKRLRKLCKCYEKSVKLRKEKNGDFYGIGIKKVTKKNPKIFGLFSRFSKIKSWVLIFNP